MYRSGMNSGSREEIFKTRLIILTGVVHATGNNMKKYSPFEVCDHASVTQIIATNSFKSVECGFAISWIYR
jgi:hypothetical protein